MALTTNFDDIFDGLGLQPSLKRKLLEKSSRRLTGTVVACTILRELGRMDVKVCRSKLDRNCYSPMLNFVGLSENVAGSDSVIAAAIAAHEVGHALQPRVIEKLSTFLKKFTMFYYLSFFGEAFIFAVQLLKALFLSTPFILSEAQKQCSQRFSISQSQRNPPHLVQSMIVLLKWIVILLFSPIIFLIAIVRGVIFSILVIVSICCALICRCLIFLDEIYASLIALHLLNKYKILDIKQLNNARKFLLLCALTYLRSSSIDRLFA